MINYEHSWHYTTGTGYQVELDVVKRAGIGLLLATAGGKGQQVMIMGRSLAIGVKNITP